MAGLPAVDVRFIPTHVGNTLGRLVRRGEDPVHPHARGEHVALHVRLTASLRFIPTHVGNTELQHDPPHRSPVHPHARGEHACPGLIHDGSDGSSPRTWGTPRRHTRKRPGRGFLPTHVGNTRSRRSGSFSCTVHPHARGEHRTPRRLGRLSDGSSPRTWGTLDPERPPRAVHRFIPTHVGNTPHAPAPGRSDSVHPHARGEHAQRQAPGQDGTRFIPTHVGNTSPGSDRPRARTVHPHARGEHSCGRRSTIRAIGSSPRTWGTLGRRRPAESNTRFIPTHVGNTSTSVPFKTTVTVHPHARGEHSRASRGHPHSGGSSPRTWGTRAPEPSPPAHHRFIPTHVGNTVLPTREGDDCTVHPHARGEHGNTTKRSSPRHGSSPRTWGTLFHQPSVFMRIFRRPLIYRAVPFDSRHSLFSCERAFAGR